MSCACNLRIRVVFTLSPVLLTALHVFCTTYTQHHKGVVWCTKMRATRKYWVKVPVIHYCKWPNKRTSVGVRWTCPTELREVSANEWHAVLCHWFAAARISPCWEIAFSWMLKTRNECQCFGFSAEPPQIFYNYLMHCCLNYGKWL